MFRVYPSFRQRHTPLELWTFDANLFRQISGCLFEDDPVAVYTFNLFLFTGFLTWLLWPTAPECRARLPRVAFGDLVPLPQEVDLPESLKTLTLGESFNQSLSGVAVPPSTSTWRTMWVTGSIGEHLRKINMGPYQQTTWDVTIFQRIFFP